MTFFFPVYFFRGLIEYFWHFLLDFIISSIFIQITRSYFIGWPNFDNLFFVFVFQFLALVLIKINLTFLDTKLIFRCISIKMSFKKFTIFLLFDILINRSTATPVSFWINILLFWNLFSFILFILLELVFRNKFLWNFNRWWKNTIDVKS